MEEQRRVRWLTKVTQQANSRASKRSRGHRVLLWAILPLLTSCFHSWYPSLITDVIKTQIKHSKCLLSISQKIYRAVFPIDLWQILSWNFPDWYENKYIQISNIQHYTNENIHSLAIRTSFRHFSVSSVDRNGNCFTILVSFPWEHFVLKGSRYKANVLETGKVAEK